MYYKKTDKGQAEIESSTRQLPQTLRMLLLLVDGQRSADELGQMLPAATADALRSLLAGGYIAAAPAPPRLRRAAGAALQAAAAPKAPNPPGGSDPAAQPDATAITRQMRTQIERSLRRALGPAADSLVDSVRQARSQQELADVLKTAQRAIANARGKDRADEFASRYGGFDGS